METPGRRLESKVLINLADASGHEEPTNIMWRSRKTSTGDFL